MDMAGEGLAPVLEPNLPERCMQDGARKAMHTITAAYCRTSPKATTWPTQSGKRPRHRRGLRRGTQRRGTSPGKWNTRRGTRRMRLRVRKHGAACLRISMYTHGRQAWDACARGGRHHRNPSPTMCACEGVSVNGDRRNLSRAALQSATDEAGRGAGGTRPKAGRGPLRRLEEAAPARIATTACDITTAPAELAGKYTLDCFDPHGGACGLPRDTRAIAIATANTSEGAASTGRAQPCDWDTNVASDGEPSRD